MRDFLYDMNPEKYYGMSEKQTLGTQKHMFNLFKALERIHYKDLKKKEHAQIYIHNLYELWHSIRHLSKADYEGYSKANHKKPRTASAYTDTIYSAILKRMKTVTFANWEDAEFALSRGDDFFMLGKIVQVISPGKYLFKYDWIYRQRYDDATHFGVRDGELLYVEVSKTFGDQDYKTYTDGDTIRAYVYRDKTSNFSYSSVLGRRTVKRYLAVSITKY